MGFKDFFKLNLEEQFGMPSDHLEGVAGYQYNDYFGVRIKCNEGYIRLEDSQEHQTILPFNQITQVNFITWETTFTKAVSPLTAGIVGGLIGGDAMAVVSAIDAKGQTRTEKVKLERALEIQYHPMGDSRTIRKLVFWDKFDFAQKKDTIRFSEKLCRLANLPAPQYITPKPQGTTYL